MGNNKYLKLHSFLRYGAALIAIIVFISMFTGVEIRHAEFSGANLNWKGAFFGDSGMGTNPTVLGFIGYLFVFIGGLTGLAFVFVDEIIGKDLTKKLAFVVGGVIILGGVFMLLTGAIFRGANNRLGINDFRLDAETIVYAIFAMIAGAANCAAPILEDKGY